MNDEEEKQEGNLISGYAKGMFMRKLREAVNDVIPFLFQFLLIFESYTTQIQHKIKEANKMVSIIDYEDAQEELKEIERRAENVGGNDTAKVLKYELSHLPELVGKVITFGSDAVEKKIKTIVQIKKELLKEAERIKNILEES